MTTEQDARLRELLAPAASGRVVVLTGAGISAESGIPTFRGEEGYWRVGSRNYHPAELATFEAWQRMPDELWSWYLYRRGVCRAALPNAAHHALVRLEEHLGERLRIVTQNVDGLHLRAGNTLERTYQIHGNIDFMRCAEECSPTLVPVPAALGAWPKERRVGASERALLTCPACGSRARPHVLWFDECYDEPRYRYDSSQKATREASLLIVVGTSGATSLPFRMVQMAVTKGYGLIVVNRDESPFTEAAEASSRGLVLRGSAGDVLPALVARVLRA